MVIGYWLLVIEFRLRLRSRVEGQESRVKSRGSRVEGQESRVEGQESRANSLNKVQGCFDAGLAGFMPGVEASVAGTCQDGVLEYALLRFAVSERP